MQCNLGGQEMADALAYRGWHKRRTRTCARQFTFSVASANFYLRSLSRRDFCACESPFTWILGSMRWLREDLAITCYYKA